MSIQITARDHHLYRAGRRVSWRVSSPICAGHTSRSLSPSLPEPGVAAQSPQSRLAFTRGLNADKTRSVSGYRTHTPPARSPATQRTGARSYGSPAISRTQKNMLSTGITGPSGTRNPRRRSGSRYAQHDHPDRHQHKRKQRPDIRQIGQRPNIEQPRRNRHHKSRHPRRKRRRPEDRMHLQKIVGSSRPATSKTTPATAPADTPGSTRSCPSARPAAPPAGPSAADARPAAAKASSARSPPAPRRPPSICHGTSPVSTTATAIYSMVQTTSVAIMPIGTSRCGFLHSSAAVETESNPIYVKKMIDPPVSTPDHPFGENGCQLRRMNELRAAEHKDQNRRQLHQHHDVIGLAPTPESRAPAPPSAAAQSETPEY